ncbi:glycosyl transferase [Clostridia bacterium]|nr:glycosyl transferase [Clostridia bacterium]
MSTTTYPPRLKTVSLSLLSVFTQSIRPGKVILYLGKNVHEGNIPKSVFKYKKYGLEIIQLPDDMQSHKKYLYAIPAFPNNIVVTVDDDIIYSRKLIESLIDAYTEYPYCALGIRTHEITFDGNNQILPYKDWNWEQTTISKPSHKLMITTVGGALYPPNIFPKLAFDKALIKKLALNNDDLWLKFIEIHANIKVVNVNLIKGRNIDIPKKLDYTLSYDNVVKGGNDIILKALMEYFGINNSVLSDLE